MWFLCDKCMCFSVSLPLQLARTLRSISMTKLQVTTTIHRRDCTMIPAAKYVVVFLFVYNILSNICYPMLFVDFIPVLAMSIVLLQPGDSAVSLLGQWEADLYPCSSRIRREHRASVQTAQRQKREAQKQVSTEGKHKTDLLLLTWLSLHLMTHTLLS